MKDGKIEIDGSTDIIMENEDKLRTCNITVPNIAKLYNKYLSLNNPLHLNKFILLFIISLTLMIAISSVFSSCSHKLELLG